MMESVHELPDEDGYFDLDVSSMSLGTDGTPIPPHSPTSAMKKPLQIHTRSDSTSSTKSIGPTTAIEILTTTPTRGGSFHDVIPTGTGATTSATAASPSLTPSTHLSSPSPPAVHPANDTFEKLSSAFFHLSAPRRVEERIPPSNGDFLSLQEWMERCIAPPSTTSTFSNPLTDRPLMRQILLLTMIYHSSPYHVLRMVLDELFTNPPPFVPQIFCQDDDDNLATSVASSASSSEPKQLHQQRPQRSADVAITKHCNLQPTKDDPLLSISPISPLREDDLISPSTSTNPSTSVASSSSVASSASIPSSSSAPSRSATSPASHTLRTPMSPMSPAGSMPIRPIPTRPSLNSSGVKQTAYSCWHARKLHLILLLHEWIHSFPQDFCCMPQAPQRSGDEPVPELVHASLSSPTSPPMKRLLEDLLYSELSHFPPASWKTQAHQNAASFHLDCPSPASSASQWNRTPGRINNQAALHLTPETIDTFSQLSRSLLLEYEASRLRYRGEEQELKLQQQALHCAPSSPFSSSSQTLLSPGSTSPTSNALPLSPTGISRTNTPWNATWGAPNVEKNLDNSKIKRMMMADTTSPHHLNQKNSLEKDGNKDTTNTTAKISPSPSVRSSMVATSSSATNKFISEFLSHSPRAYAHALTWLAIQRMDEIGSCCLDGGDASDKKYISYHHPAPLPSDAFLRLFLSMPSQLSRRQMKMSNTMSCFVATTILNTPTVAVRKQVIQHWLDIADHCLGTHSSTLPKKEKEPTTSGIAQPTNFMHCFEIIYGINHQSVYRLPAIQLNPNSTTPNHKASFLGSMSSNPTVLPLLHKRNFATTHAYEVYTQLTKLTSPNQNYKEYRKALSDAQAEPAANNAFYVPYLGILLKDLVGLEEAGKPLAGVLGPEPTHDEEDEEDVDVLPPPLPNRDSNATVVELSLPASSSLPHNESASDLDSLAADPPTGSLPWDDSFLVRPRRNATLCIVPSQVGTLPSAPRRSSGLEMLHGEDEEEDIFATPSSVSPPTVARVRSVWEDVGKRESLFHMLTEEDTLAVAGQPKKSLLTEALPKRLTNGGENGGVMMATDPSFNSPESAAPIVLTPSTLLLNYSKLSKIYQLVSSTLRCRLHFPCVPLEDDADLLAQFDSAADAPKTRDRSMTKAAYRYARAGGGRGASLSQMASFQQAINAAMRQVTPGVVLESPFLTSSEKGELKNVVEETGLPSRPPPILGSSSPSSSLPPHSSSSVTLPFDRRLQHWLLSSMLTLTLKDEQQLMERSYTIYPRKQQTNINSPNHTVRDVPAPRLVGIEPNPGPFGSLPSSGPAAQITTSTPSSNPVIAATHELTAQTLFMDGILSIYQFLIYQFLSLNELLPALQSCQYFYECGLKERCREVEFDFTTPYNPIFKHRFQQFVFDSSLKYHVTIIRGISIWHIISIKHLRLPNLRTLICNFDPSMYELQQTFRTIHSPWPVNYNMNTARFTSSLELPPSITSIQIDSWTCKCATTYALWCSFMDSLPSNSKLTNFKFRTYLVTPRLFNFSQLFLTRKLTHISLYLSNQRFQKSDQLTCANLPLISFHLTAACSPDWTIFHPSSPLMLHVQDFSWCDLTLSNGHWSHLSTSPPPHLQSMTHHMTNDPKSDLIDFTALTQLSKLKLVRSSMDQSNLFSTYGHSLSGCASITHLQLSGYVFTDDELCQILRSLIHLSQLDLLGDESDYRLKSSFQYFPPSVMIEYLTISQLFGEFLKSLSTSERIKLLQINRFYIINAPYVTQQDFDDLCEQYCHSMSDGFTLKIGQLKTYESDYQLYTYDKFRLTDFVFVNSNQTRPSLVGEYQKMAHAIEPPASRLVGIELNPGPACSITAQTLFTDGLHTILSFLDLNSLCECLRTCHHFLHAAQTEPNRHIWFEVKRKHLKLIEAGSTTLLRHISYLILPVEEYDSDCIFKLHEVIDLIHSLPNLHTLSGPFSGDSLDLDPGVHVAWPQTLRTWQLYVRPVSLDSVNDVHYSYPNLLKSILQVSSLTTLFVSATLFQDDDQPPQPMAQPFKELTNLQRLTISHWVLFQLCSSVGGNNAPGEDEMKHDYFPSSLTYLDPSADHDPDSLWSLESFRRFNLDHLKELEVSYSDGHLDDLHLFAPQLEVISSQSRDDGEVVTIPLKVVDKWPKLKAIGLVVHRFKSPQSLRPFLTDDSRTLDDPDWINTQLTHLDFLSVPLVNDAGLWEVFARHFPHVNSLTLGVTPMIRENILKAFGAHTQHVTLLLRIGTTLDMLKDIIPDECTQIKTIRFIHSYPSINFIRTSECYEVFHTKFVDLERLEFISRDHLDLPTGPINPRTDLVIHFHPRFAPSIVDTAPEASLLFDDENDGLEPAVVEPPLDPVSFLKHKEFVAVRNDTQPGEDVDRLSVRTHEGGQYRISVHPQPLNGLGPRIGYREMQYTTMVSNRRSIYNVPSNQIDPAAEYRKLAPKTPIHELEAAIAANRRQDIPLLKLQLADILMCSLGIPEEQRDPHRACDLYYQAADVGLPEAMTQVADICRAKLMSLFNVPDFRRSRAFTRPMLKSKVFQQMIMYLGEAAERGHFSPRAYTILEAVTSICSWTQMAGICREYGGAEACQQAYEKYTVSLNKRIKKQRRNEDPSEWQSSESASKSVPSQSSSSSSATPTTAMASAHEPGSVPPLPHTCCVCGKSGLPRSAFASSQLKKMANLRKCLVCASAVHKEGMIQEGK